MTRFRYIILFIVFGIHSGVCVAQTPDSSAIQLSSPMWHEFQRMILKHTLASTAGILVQPFKEFKGAELGFTHASGDLRHVQTAQTTKTLSFETSGVQSLGKWVLYGHFAYQRDLLDSLSWDLQGRHEGGRPYYMASPKAGNWDNESYQLTGNASYHLSPSWQLGGGMKFYVYDAARSNDPRPSYGMHNIDLEGFVAKKIGRITLASGIHYGYSSDNSSVIYSNENENDKPSSKDYLSYEFLGYGYIRNTIKFNRTLESTNKHHGAFLQAHQDVGGGKLWGRYGIRLDSDSTFRQRIDYTANKNRLATYKLTSQEVTLAWNRRGASLGIYSMLRWDSQKGSDQSWVQLAGANNYVYQAYRMQWIGSVQRLQGGKDREEFGWSIGLDQENKMDGMSQHDYSREIYHLATSYTRYLPARSKGDWFVGMLPSLYIRQSKLEVPHTQVNLFTEAIAYAEYYYNNTDELRVKLRAGYSHSVSPHKSLRFNLTVGRNMPIRHKVDFKYPSGTTYQAKGSWTTVAFQTGFFF